MKILYSLLVLGLMLSCVSGFANAAEIEQVMNFDDVPNRKLEFHEGYTEVTLMDYHVKITAEQRLGDRLAQVIVFGQQQYARFHLSHVEFGVMPPHRPPHGLVAKVSGIFVFQESNIGKMRRVHMMIPVQIRSVTEFTVSNDEARVEGYTCIERKLPKMLSEQ
jgi:hypothetical protein